MTITVVGGNANLAVNFARTFHEPQSQGSDWFIKDNLRREFTRENIEYEKILCPGHVLPPNSIVKR
ncbi:hypothetical protein J6590_029434 [Homalodisca vitripennis]|nr:hypothetical protein J6590_029434 [Homalodisca vitripennis]